MDIILERRCQSVSGGWPHKYIPEFKSMIKYLLNLIISVIYSSWLGMPIHKVVHSSSIVRIQAISKPSFRFLPPSTNVYMFVKGHKTKKPGHGSIVDDIIHFPHSEVFTVPVQIDGETSPINCICSTEYESYLTTLDRAPQFVYTTGISVSLSDLQLLSDIMQMPCIVFTRNVYSSLDEMHFYRPNQHSSPRIRRLWS